MYQKKIANTLTCGSVLTKEVLHGKWKSTLLVCMAQGIQRPSAMQRMLPSASRRVLNVQLSELEHHGLISKTIFPELPPKVEYHLTDLGRSLLPVIEVMEQWGNAHRTELEQVLAGNIAELPG
ncbi:winged helix-turn-helix transcriptional regulator [Hymenobacter chitinivorans]|uniref:DNA-binding HxlR family transcriptional regulator n=1 Tax=Hymenobacter chitinivorans DSM 11115 TaxID=1121954 RepID=A0A2M9B939_9BACT|nr:helix-turn-helix domain-containing protein [Hymenobacter chitinivorans]PJJ54475.1 DNA-binding HxlR family transcriptional regulator [Hymenobacter chitinivorans DSM 11115]